ncbi:MAG: STAS domain-containing protein [Actinomycetota bacterium]
MSSTTLLVLTTERRNGVAVISFEGDIDIASVDRLEEELVAVERNETIGIVLDFARLEFIDSTGLHWIDRAHRRAALAGRILAVSNDSSAIKRTFELVGMGSLLNTQAVGGLLERFSSAGEIDDPLLPSARGGNHA